MHAVPKGRISKHMTMQNMFRTITAAVLACSLLAVPIRSFAEGDDVVVVEQEAEVQSDSEAIDSEATPTEQDIESSDETSQEADEPASADPSSPNLAEARAACVMDTYGNVIWELDADEELPMASITKVMTAMVALDSGIDLDKTFDFVKTDFQEDAQLAGYDENDSPSLGELLKVTLIYSGNDAALNVAYAVAGSKEAFASLMNEKAAEIGMTHTHFMNPHGLEEDNHYSCARDLCIMGRYAMEHYPFIRVCVQTPSITIHPRGDEVTLSTTDHLMEYYDGLRGIKTGNTESGASFLGSARRYHNTLYSCVLCCETVDGRFSDTATLLDWAFDGFEYWNLSRAGRVIGYAPWEDGFWLRCPVYAERSVTGSGTEGVELAHSDKQLIPGTLDAAHSNYGTSVWKQDKRLVASVSYQTGGRTTQDRSWSPLMLPVMSTSEG